MLAANSIVSPHIYGITHFEDNIQDEWFIVSLLFEISRQIPDLIIRCIDGDGEFMLIEAAEYLPNWANPDTCEGCVSFRRPDQKLSTDTIKSSFPLPQLFILNGDVHLIDCTTINGKKPSTITDRLIELRHNSTAHIVTSSIAKCIAARIVDFPAGIADNLHCATVYVPVAAAALLRHNSQLISSAVRAFCHRDQIDLKACRAMKHFPPENRVYTRITFTKCLYAMLMHQNYVPDRRTGWNLPKTTDPTYKAHLMGVKLASGFEILAAQAKPTETIETSKCWQSYFESLHKRGYFQGFLENSKDFVRLLLSAKQYYATHVANVPPAQEVGQDILATLKTLDFGGVDDYPNESNLLTDDNDDWMNISPEDLDNMLAKRYGIKTTIGGAANGNFDPAAAFELTDNIAQFLDKKSDFTGAEIDDGDQESMARPVPPIRVKRATAMAKKLSTDPISETDSPTGTQIDFNPDSFQNHIHEMLNLIIPEDNWESNSDMSDFGEDTDLDRNIDEMSRDDASNDDASRTEIEKYMDQMDRELARTTIGQSFEKAKQTTAKGLPATKQSQHKSSNDDNFEDIEEFTPVDIDVNTLKNMAHSYQSQFGGPGPTSSLLGSMGIKLKGMDYVDDFNVPNTQV